MRRELLYSILALAVLALAVIPIGIAVFVLGFVYGDSPCVMCWEQRIGMALVALVGLFVLRYGPKPKYIGLAVLIAHLGRLHGHPPHGDARRARRRPGVQRGDPRRAHLHLGAVHLLGVRGDDGPAADADEEGGHRGPAAIARAAGRAGRDRLPRRHRRQHRPGVCQHRSAAVHGAERSRAVLLLAEALGVVARGMVAGADLAARAVGDRQAEPRRASGRPGGGTARRPAGRGRHRPARRSASRCPARRPTSLRPGDEPVPRDDRSTASTWRTTRWRS